MIVVSVGLWFYVKKWIIVGNILKYILLDRWEDNDKLIYKWMVYVWGLFEDLYIDWFVKKVWFFFYLSYCLNDIVEVNKFFFYLIRRGWGEFIVCV